MSVNPDGHDEYARRHRMIWPELEDTLLAHGVRTYSIYLDPATNDLFGYAEVESEEQWAAIAATPVCRRWWKHMRELMPSNPDDSPVSRDLREVFHIERRVAGDNGVTAARSSERSTRRGRAAGRSEARSSRDGARR